MTPDSPWLEMEWLTSDGLGGFASGTVSGVRTRRYHALLVAATQPPSGRMVLINGFDAWVQIHGRCIPIGHHLYAPNAWHPELPAVILQFTPFPHPTWIYDLLHGVKLKQEFRMFHGHACGEMTWTLLMDESTPPIAEAQLFMRPLFSGRDFHGLHHENPVFNFEPQLGEHRMAWHPYPGVPAILSKCNGNYRHDPVWYRDFLYLQEQERGLDCIEDLASPGVQDWNLKQQPAQWLFAAEGLDYGAFRVGESVEIASARLRSEQDAHILKVAPSYLDTSRRTLLTAADAYVVRRGDGSTLIAGYPWFGDWGRDTFISLRGLCLATGRLADARSILLEWSEYVSAGMLPNRFPDNGQEPEYNSVDASLWFIIAAQDYLNAASAASDPMVAQDRKALGYAMEAILTGYAHGTRHGIRMDDDALLLCGERGIALTWMDARVNGVPITPRMGKPVEIQALWLNALWIGAEFSEHWSPFYARGLAAFQARFWNSQLECLYDVVDCEGRKGEVDASIRPNQIFAVGGLPRVLLSEAMSLKVLETVERKLLTPMGLRTLAPGEVGYTIRYEGSSEQRDSVYHQGIVWPWLMGPFVEAWLRVHGQTPESRRQVTEFFLPSLEQHLEEAGVGHLSEITDSEEPHTPRGCPFQAWSLGEWLRIRKMLEGSS